MPESSSLKSHWSLDDSVVFLNHGSFGACPTAVLEVQNELRKRIERQPVLFLAREVVPLLDEAKAELGAFVGADPEDMAFVSNATTGVNTVLRSLRFEPGDEILVTDHGYNACKNVVTFAAERAGARVVVAEVPFPIAGPDEILDAVLAAATEKTRLALLDHVTSPTGIIYPIARLIAALRERGIETMVDGAHAPGMVPLDVESLGAGYYTGNCHKWICAPKGAAFLHVRRDLQRGIRPASISHGANDPRTDRSRFRLEFDWTGTVDPSAFLCVPHALRFMGSVLPGGWDEVRRRNHALAVEGRRILLDALGAEAAAPDEMLGSLASIPLELVDDAGTSAWDIDPLKRTLYDEDRIELPIMGWPQPRLRLLRISAQLYNDRAQYEHLAEALVRHGARALGAAARA